VLAYQTPLKAYTNINCKFHKIYLALDTGGKENYHKKKPKTSKVYVNYVKVHIYSRLGNGYSERSCLELLVYKQKLHVFTILFWENKNRVLGLHFSLTSK